MADKNPLRVLESFGQSIWLDFIRRSMLVSGDFQRLVEEDGLTGFTSNPSIFDKVIAGSHDYDEAIDALVLEGRTAEAIYEELALADVRTGADVLRPVFEATNGRDGCASFEVSPKLAYDANATVADAKRLSGLIARPNALIKVPATQPGLDAIRRLTAAGINVNVTLLFGLPRYRQVAEAYISGLEERLAAGERIDAITSVASFFLSRIDVKVDPMLDDIVSGGGDLAKLAGETRGKVAIGSAKIAYRMYGEIFGGDRFAKLAQHGARPQRLLWASTSTKDPLYSDVMYVDALIGPDTVNTLPLETLNAYREHGEPAARLTQDVDEAQETLDSLPTLRIDLAKVTSALEQEGVAKFEHALDSLLEAVRSRRQGALREPLDRQSASLGAYASAVDERLGEFERDHVARRIWRKDPSLWVSGVDASRSVRDGLGWLDLPEKTLDHVPDMERFARQARDEGFTRVVHMGMGGSSLAPLLFARTFKPRGEGLPLIVLDTTDPATIKKVEQDGDLSTTLFVVASKSGATAETIALKDYFLDRVKSVRGAQAGTNFVAITDRGSPLERASHAEGFRRCFLNYPDVGGRYSALSLFGLLPATLMGIDSTVLLEHAARVRNACAASVPARRNPGMALGAVMGELALKGRDKVTFLTPASLVPLGAWLEQLLAESTGKQGKGLLPVVGERVGPPSAYGNDRQFVRLSLGDGEDPILDEAVAGLSDAGHPVMTVALESRDDVGDAFYRFEMAVAAAGIVLGVNAFDQPNVQESKDITKQMLNEIDAGTAPTEREPQITGDAFALFGDVTGHDAPDALERFFGAVRPGDFVAIMAYLTEEPTTDHALDELRAGLGSITGAATTLGYGPRFLHSTGQYHKGGPNTGLFLQITADDHIDMPIPGRSYTFGQFRRAQALGDLEALKRHGRRVLRVHLGADVSGGLEALTRAASSGSGAAR